MDAAQGVTVEEYMKRVTVVFSLSAPLMYKVTTVGMAHYARLDLELVDVPALWVPAAGDLLNEWALYSINKRALKAGHTLSGGYRDRLRIRLRETPEGLLRLCPEARLRAGEAPHADA